MGRYEVHGKPGVLVDDKDMLFKMAFVDFDEDRRQSVTETFCVDLDQLDIDSSDVSDWDKVQHPSGEPRFFIPGFPQFGGQNGDDLDVKIPRNTTNSSVREATRRKSLAGWTKNIARSVLHGKMLRKGVVARSRGQ